MEVSKRFCFICTQIPSISHRSDPKQIASPGVLRSSGHRGGTYLSRHQNRSTGSQTRFQTFIPSIVVIVDRDNFVQYDLPKLKSLALDHIQKNIQGCDIVRETFSVFTSRCVWKRAAPQRYINMSMQIRRDTDPAGDSPGIRLVIRRQGRIGNTP